MAFYLFLFTVLYFTAQVRGDSPPTSDFTFDAILDESGSFRLFWKPMDEDKVVFQLHAATKGWASVGFSPNGAMGGADIVLFWFDANGKPMISDRYATENGFPPEDSKQDYTLMDAKKNDTHLIATFYRKRNTCDPQDYVLTEDTVRVIYASNDAVPQGKDNFRKHTVRGSKSVHLFDNKIATPDGQPPEKGARPLEFRVNQVHVPDNESTTYWCEVLVMPKVDKKLHIIKIEPVIEKQNIDVVHHILVYICSKNMAAWVGKGQSCFDSEGENEVAEFSECKQQVMAGWAVGGMASTYPDNVGFPIYNDGLDLYVMMEMHYDNSNLKKGKVDSSGMRVWVTENVRPIDAGQAMFGIPVSAQDQVIPPGLKEFTNYGYCSAKCTDGFPKDGIKVLGGLPHTHLTGRKVRLTHFRNGKQLPHVMSDEHYDFNYQDVRRLKEPVTILPGDQLIVECVYETTGRTKTTFSGHRTQDEMCLVFMDYYPAVYRGFACISSPDERALYKTIGLTNIVPFNESNPFDNRVIMPNGQMKALNRYLREDFKFDWTPEKIEQFQKASRDVQHTVICVRQDLNKPEMNFTAVNGNIEGLDFFEQDGYPKAEPLTIFDECKNNGGNNADREENRSNRNGQAISSPQLRERNNGSQSMNFVGHFQLILISIASIFLSLLTA